MPDIRLVRPRTSQIWLWTGLLAAVALLVWASTFIFGDPTDPVDQPRVGAAAEFDADRAPILPIEPVSFEAVAPIEQGDLGRLVRLDATAESRVASIGQTPGVWVRTADGRRILVRFEPPPPEGALSGIRAGGAVNVEGYIQNISRAEVSGWADTLGVRIPRPPPAPRFGQLPSPEFEQLDALFIRDFYISVRPQGINPESGEQE